MVDSLQNFAGDVRPTRSSILSQKTKAILLLLFAEMAGMSLWFQSAAVLADMAREGGLDATRQALMSSVVQAGFVLGALLIAITGIADRLDPRKVFALSAIAAAAANLSLLALPIGGDAAIAARFLTGVLLAGVYPVGMKIAVGWGTKDRGLLVGSLVAALTLGKALPYLAAYVGDTEWRPAVVVISLLAALGGLLAFTIRLGPHHARAAAFRPQAIALAWTDRRIRRAYIGYLGHMWELYVMWAWIGTAAAISYAATRSAADAESLAKLTAFAAIALGAVFCVPAGWLADRIGKAEVTILALVVSGSAGLATAATFGGPVWITATLMILWGIAIVPDSAQFSAIVADSAPPEFAGSLLTFQTALGFALTAVTVQFAPTAAAAIGWPALLAGLALGPAIAIVAMVPLTRAGRTPRP